MSYTRLRYHFVFATKNRQPLIDETMEKPLYRKIRDVAGDIGGHVFAVGGVPDHVHLVAAVRPTVALSDFIQDLKSRTSATMNQLSTDIQTFEWQIGFGGFTLDPDNLDWVISYVRNQKHHHADNQVMQVYETLTADETNGGLLC